MSSKRPLEAKRPLEVLKADIDRLGGVAPEAWDGFARRIAAATFAKKDVVFGAGAIADSVLFVADGVAASEQVLEDGASSIARFFEPPQMAANVTSLVRREPAHDALIAMTPVAGVVIPYALFAQEYFDGDQIGRYLRAKTLETLLFDKEVICAKTQTSTEARYRFLLEHHTDVVARTPDKDIARFLGITPQGLSRFLRTRGGRT